MDGFTNSLTALTHSIVNNFPLVIVMIGALWVVQFLNVASGYYFNRFGIWPRRKKGIPGIIICPILHGSFEHLFLNSIFLFALMNLVLPYGIYVFSYATAIIVVLGGLLVWLFGRPAIHIGASGLAMGYWGFLLLAAYTQGSIMAILLGGICLYFFAGLFFNLFPKDKRTSWEGHLYGFIAGLVAAIAIRYI
jgi:membrane associated rhomboid family serine protease